MYAGLRTITGQDKAALGAPLGRVVERDREHCQLVLGNLFLTLSAGVVTAENVASMVTNLDAFFARLGKGRQGAFVLVTQGTAKPPPAPSRAAIQRVFAKHAHQLAAVAIVIEVTGFSAAALRAVASTLFVLAQRQLPVKFFAEASACVDWVSLEAEAPAGSLVRLLAQAKSLVGS